MTPRSSTTRQPFTGSQKRILVALACTVGLRMLGLFLVMPVFTLYGLEFTPSRFLVGFAFGAYGLMMAALQIPMGRLSDRIGRRRVLAFGMALFAIGSVLCATPHWFPSGAGIWVLIVGRLVQGGGAVVSVAFAAVADHFAPERRATAMAVLGIPIGAAFAVGVIVGPIIAGAFGTASLFWLSSAAAVGAVALIIGWVPETLPSGGMPTPVAALVRTRALLPLDLCGFLMNFFMATFFFYFPLIVTSRYHVSMAHYYLLLLPMAFVSAFTMFGFSRGADHGWGRRLASLAFLIMIPSAIGLFHPEAIGLDPTRLSSLLVAGTLFYIGFTGLEPVLPSLVTRASSQSAHGSALGVYNTFQFFGSFAGGAVAGLLAAGPPIRAIAVLVTAAVAGVLLAW